MTLSELFDERDMLEDEWGNDEELGSLFRLLDRDTDNKLSWDGMSTYL